MTTFQVLRDVRVTRFRGIQLERHEGKRLPRVRVYNDTPDIGMSELTALRELADLRRYDIDGALQTLEHHIDEKDADLEVARQTIAAYEALMIGASLERPAHFPHMSLNFCVASGSEQRDGAHPGLWLDDAERLADDYERGHFWGARAKSNGLLDKVDLPSDTLYQAGYRDGYNGVERSVRAPLASETEVTPNASVLDYAKRHRLEPADMMAVIQGSFQPEDIPDAGIDPAGRMVDGGFEEVPNPVYPIEFLSRVRGVIEDRETERAEWGLS